MADSPSKPVRTHFESKMLSPTSGSSSASSSPTKSKVVRSQRIASAVASSSTTTNIAEEDGNPAGAPPTIPRSHTPGHLSSKSQSQSQSQARSIASGRKASESSMRSRSQSASQAAITRPKGAPPALTLSNTLTHATASRMMPVSENNTSAASPDVNHGDGDRPSLEKRDSNATNARKDTASSDSTTATPTTNTKPPSSQQLEVRRLTGMRSTSTITSKVASAGTSRQRQTSTTATMSSQESGAGPRRSRDDNKKESYTAFPPLQDPRTAPDVPAAPSSSMYWSRAPVSGISLSAFRAHTVTIVGSNIFAFGGCDSKVCFNELYVLDADSFHWSSPFVVGDIPVPLRAMTCTAVGKKLVVFGGGDGPVYYNEVYVLDTTNFRWTKPRITGDQYPSKRRAHTACLYKNGIYVFGGGDGVRALNEMWRLDVTDTNKMSWKLVDGPPSSASNGAVKSLTEISGKDMQRPKARGYHTANIVGSKLIIFGGSDGDECFNDVWVYDVDTNKWSPVAIPVTHRRLSHTSTLVGSFLFVIGGHDGKDYSNDVLLLNLVTMMWDKRKVNGTPPLARGYHGAVLYDSRVLVIGGFGGVEVFNDVWILELGVYSYYPQISHFSIEV